MNTLSKKQLFPGARRPAAWKTKALQLAHICALSLAGQLSSQQGASAN